VILDHVVVSSQTSAVTLDGLAETERSVLDERLILSAFGWAVNNRSVASSSDRNQQSNFPAVHLPSSDWERKLYRS
jgi:hypothetical protein